MKKILLSVFGLFFGVTLFGQTYCTPLFSTGCAVGDQIQNFSTTGGITNISNLNSGCSPGNYSYISNQTLEVSPAATFGFTVQAGASWSQGFRIWIDYNQNGSFTDPGEDVWNSGTFGTQPFTGTVTIPATASTGLTRMRVRCSFVAVPTDPCTQQSYGEVEDYDILIKPLKKGTNNASCSDLVAPVAFCPGTVPVTVEVKNTGFNAINSLTVGWSLNGVAQTAVSYNSTLDTAGGSNASSANITLGNATFAPNQTITLKAWTSNPNNVADTANGDDTLTVDLKPSLSGVYSIGGLTPDYTSFGAAIADLNNNGICGPVVFNVRSGIYNEQVDIGEISGSSATNTITFQPDTSATTAPTVQFLGSSSANYVWSISGGDYITVRGLNIIATGTTYSRVIDITGNSSFILFEDDSIANAVVSTTSNLRAPVYINAGATPSDISFDHCDITGGSYGMYLRGSSTTSRMANVSVTNCRITDYYYMGIYNYYGTGSVVNYNYIRPSGSYTFPYGLYYFYQDGSPKMIGNDYAYDSPSGGYALYTYYWEGTANDRALIANNFVLQENAGATSTNYGLYMYGHDETDVYHNTIVQKSGNTSTRCLYYSAPTTGYTDVNIVNNILVTYGATQSFYITSTAASHITLMDYNDVYSAGALGYYGTTTVANLAALQSASGMNANSLSVLPVFKSATDLHLDVDPNLDGAALPLANLTTDIDQEQRSTTKPDIGADEFRGPPNNAGLADVVYPRNPLCGSIDPRVWVNVINSGDSILDSVTISYQVLRAGGSLPLRTLQHATNLLPGQVDSNIVLPNFQGGFQAGDTVIVYTSFPNNIPDSLSKDDSLIIYMIDGFAGGHFVIGDTSSAAAIQADFPNFTEAANFLDSVGGICDSVIFDVIDSTFNEQLVVNHILGTSPTVPIIFRGMNGAASTARLRFTTNLIDSNFTVWLNGGQNIIFENLTIENPGALLIPPGGFTGLPFGTVVKADQAHQSIFSNVVFNGSKNTSTESSIAIMDVGNTDDFWVNNSRFNDGSIGIDLDGGNNILVNDNLFRNQYAQGAVFNTTVDIEFAGNEMVSNSGYVTPTNGTNYAAQLVFNNISGGVDAHNNVIYGRDQFPLYGVAFVGSQAKANNKNLLYNNFIGVGASYSGFDFAGVALINSDFTVVANNNVAMDGNGNNSTGLLAVGGSQNEVVNNSFANFGFGKAVIYDSPFSVINSNHNNLFTNGPTLAEYSGAAYVDVVSWSAVGYDLNSVSSDPQYYNVPDDLHVCNLGLDGKGIPLPFALGDIDGDPKDPTTPDIGADEFTPLSDFSLGVDTGLCIGASMTLTGGRNTGDINVWSTGDSTFTLPVNAAGSYSLTLINECGITQDTISVTYQTPVSLPNDTNICAKTTLDIDAGLTNVSYNWNNGETTQKINVAQAGTYAIQVRDVYGCVSRDTIIVTQSGLAEIAGDTVVCGNIPTFLQATPNNATYNWSGGQNTGTIFASNAGIYWVEVNDKGCLSRDTIVLKAKQLSNANYTAVMNYLTFDVLTNNSVGTIHHWDFGDGNTSSLKLPTHLYSAPGIYQVIYRVNNECDTSSASEEVRAIGVGIDEMSTGENMVIYPNPSNGMINILIDQANEVSSIEVIDLQGRMVYNNYNIATAASNLINLNLDIAKGTYILKLKTKTDQYIERFDIK